MVMTRRCLSLLANVFRQFIMPCSASRRIGRPPGRAPVTAPYEPWRAVPIATPTAAGMAVPVTARPIPIAPMPIAVAGIPRDPRPSRSPRWPSRSPGCPSRSPRCPSSPRNDRCASWTAGADCRPDLLPRRLGLGLGAMRCRGRLPGPYCPGRCSGPPARSAWPSRSPPRWPSRSPPYPRDRAHRDHYPGPARRHGRPGRHPVAALITAVPAVAIPAAAAAAAFARVGATPATAAFATTTVARRHYPHRHRS